MHPNSPVGIEIDGLEVSTMKVGSGMQTFVNELDPLTFKKSISDEIWYKALDKHDSVVQPKLELYERILECYRHRRYFYQVGLFNGIIQPNSNRKTEKNLSSEDRDFQLAPHYSPISPPVSRKSSIGCNTETLPAANPTVPAPGYQIPISTPTRISDEQLREIMGCSGEVDDKLPDIAFGLYHHICDYYNHILYRHTEPLIDAYIPCNQTGNANLNGEEIEHRSPKQSLISSTSPMQSTPINPMRVHSGDDKNSDEIDMDDLLRMTPSSTVSYNDKGSPWRCNLSEKFQKL